MDFYINTSVTQTSETDDAHGPPCRTGSRYSSELRVSDVMGLLAQTTHSFMMAMRTGLVMQVRV